MPDPNTRTPAPKASGQRTQTACPRDGPPREDEPLNLHLPQNCGRHPPPPGSPPVTSTAHNASLQERTLWGRWWFPAPAPPAPSKHGQRDGQPGEGERLLPDGPHNRGRSPPPRGNLRPPPRRATPCRASTPRGQCQVRKSARPHLQPASSGPRPPAAGTGSWDRMSA